MRPGISRLLSLPLPISPCFAAGSMPSRIRRRRVSRIEADSPEQETSTGESDPLETAKIKAIAGKGKGRPRSVQVHGPRVRRPGKGSDTTNSLDADRDSTSRGRTTPRPGAIAAATGVSKSQVDRDLSGVPIGTPGLAPVVGVVADLRREGMSTRAIAAATGISDITVRRDLTGASNVAPVVGTDGKTYQPTRPQPPTPSPRDRDAGVTSATPAVRAAVGPLVGPLPRK